MKGLKVGKLNSETISMILRYARVSTKDQNLNLKLEALKKAGTEKYFRKKYLELQR